MVEVEAPAPVKLADNVTLPVTPNVVPTVAAPVTASVAILAVPAVVKFPPVMLPVATTTSTFHKKVPEHTTVISMFQVTAMLLA